MVHLPQEVFSENSVHQYPEGLKFGLPGPLPHTLAHGVQAWRKRCTLGLQWHGHTQ
ncbi:hypothetical protein A6R68_03984 [Neotoma lepida]|uniref:Uncharacterized protein n=1 Tax=Neotoma lepida TaxID=56216 RepID=A0A1A6GP48_NEOLE|nr:hypothetical protein A6R68_03984 [Neotoma lepida]